MTTKFVLYVLKSCHPVKSEIFHDLHKWESHQSFLTGIRYKLAVIDYLIINSKMRELTFAP